jgi:hypothetical protein
LSLDRVHRFITRHKDTTTFVFVEKGVAKCIAAKDVKAQQNINRIMLGFYKHMKPVGFYTDEVNEDHLAQDLRYCGVMT